MFSVWVQKIKHYAECQLPQRRRSPNFMSHLEITNGLLHDRHDTRNTVKSLDNPPPVPLVKKAPEMANNSSVSLHLNLLKGFLKGR